MVKYSATMGALLPAMFTNDPVVLAHVCSLQVIGPAKGRAVWLQLVADGLRDDAALTGVEFEEARDAVTAGLDLATLAAPYLVTAADLMPTEPVAGNTGAIGGVGTNWVRIGWCFKIDKAYN